jgi:elongation factor P--(R)-beta-lysine ligase
LNFRPSASWQRLRERGGLLARLRRFFDEQGFCEVETPLLSADVVVDRHLDPIAVTLPDDPRRPGLGRPMWLQTSPEFAMKRLLAAGAEAIYQISRSFRGGESGRLHNPEFTIVEWYRTGDGLSEAMRLLSSVAELFFERGPAETISYADAFRAALSIDPIQASLTELANAARRSGTAIPQSMPADDRDAWLDLLMAECVQPGLGAARPVIVYDYPASQAALARLKPGEPELAERFELFFHGVELANGYVELLDPAVLRARAAEANRHRLADGRPALPEENRLLEAMESGLPACAGVALGFDRAVMLAMGANSIAEVMAFPIDRA